MEKELMQALQKEILRLKKTEFSAMSGAERLFPAEYALLAVTQQQQDQGGNKPTMSMLCKILEVKPSTITELVERLQKKGHLVKEASPLDKRAKCLSLTDLGLEALARHREEVVAHLSAMAEHIGQEDTEKLLEILTKINEFTAEQQQRGWEASAETGKESIC